MKKYLNKEGFVSFIDQLEEDKPEKLYTESLEDGSTEHHIFMKMTFNGYPIVLYEHPYCEVGIIQNTSVASWEDYAEDVYDDFVVYDEYKIFIECD